MAALTVLLLHHHGVADGQQAPKLPHHLVLIVPNSAHELRVSVKKLPIGKFVPEVGVLLCGGVRGRWVVGASLIAPAPHCPALQGGKGSPYVGSPPLHPGLGKDPPHQASALLDPRGSHSPQSPLSGFLGPLDTADKLGLGLWTRHPKQPRTPSLSSAFRTKEAKRQPQLLGVPEDSQGQNSASRSVHCV